MSEFDEYCDRVNSLPVEIKAKHIEELTNIILPTLKKIAEEEDTNIDYVSIYLDFVLAAVGADGKLSKEEYLLTKPFFDSVSGGDTTYEVAVEIFHDSGISDPSTYKNTVDLMADMLGLISEDLKNAIVNLTLLICAIDGEITESEKDWILQLVDDSFGYNPMEEIYDFLSMSGAFTLATYVRAGPR